MSIRLDDGSRFRIIDQNNKNVTFDKTIDPNKVKIQIDTDKDGKFDGKNDITIDDPSQISLLTDKLKGNAKSIENVPFVDEIESHILNVPKISKLLDEGGELGKKAKDISAIFHKDEKIATGKAAFEKTQTAFRTDPSNPIAKFGYAIALTGIKESTFSSIAISSLGLDFPKESKIVMAALEKDKYDIMGQMMLKRLYTACDMDDKASQVDGNLSSLKNKLPQEYKEAETRYTEAAKNLD